VALLATPGGRLAIAEHSTGALTRMSLDGGFGRPLRLKSHPDALTIGPDGDVWYVAGDEGKIGHVRR
jgi:streptogramin lyase